MREDFLHYLWRHRRFDHQALETTDRQPVEILYPGEYNTNAGPDFFNARIRIANTLWAGNIEMHLNASEWLAHGHDTDPAYDNVVLHVVYEEDKRIVRRNGESLPCLIMRNRIPARLLESYKRLEHESNWIPCQASIAAVSNFTWNNWLDRLMVERLETQTEAIERLLQQNQMHWEQVFFQRLAWNFGLKVNAEPFLALAQSLPIALLGKHRNVLLQLEALLFGQAGLLGPELHDEYAVQLNKEYGFLRHKYALTPLPSASWKFSRLRPANFPTVRIAQLAALLHQSAHLLAEAIEAPDLKSLEQLFLAPLSPYWYTHYQFDKASIQRPKLPGRDLLRSIVINTVAPILFLYGKKREIPQLQQKALSLLEALPPESNTVLDGWLALGFKLENAHQTQAAIHLKTRYCDARKCLQCAIGNAIVGGGEDRHANSQRAAK